MKIFEKGAKIINVLLTPEQVSKIISIAYEE